MGGPVMTAVWRLLIPRTWHMSAERMRALPVWPILWPAVVIVLGSVAILYFTAVRKQERHIGVPAGVVAILAGFTAVWSLWINLHSGCGGDCAIVLFDSRDWFIGINWLGRWLAWPPNWLRGDPQPLPASDSIPAALTISTMLLAGFAALLAFTMGSARDVIRLTMRRQRG